MSSLSVTLLEWMVDYYGYEIWSCSSVKMVVSEDIFPKWSLYLHCILLFVGWREIHCGAIINKCQQMNYKSHLCHIILTANNTKYDISASTSIQKKTIITIPCSTTSNKEEFSEYFSEAQTYEIIVKKYLNIGKIRENLYAILPYWS